jgi:hypothetical protein
MRVQIMPALVIGKNKRHAVQCWQTGIDILRLKLLKRVPRLQIRQTFTNRHIDETSFGLEGREKESMMAP